jgi:hypothetical protein
VKQKKNRPARQPGGSCCACLPPAAQSEMQQQAKGNCGQRKGIWYAANGYVIHRAHNRAEKRASRIRKLGIQFPHGILSVQQCGFALHSCKAHRAQIQG